jgi:large subunit ribosomal protein L1
MLQRLRSASVRSYVRSASHLVKTRPLKPYPLSTAVNLSKAFAVANFDETMSVSLQTGLDPRKPNQTIRGSVVLPHGTGKLIKVAVFAEGAKAVEAKAAGAFRVGGEDLIEEIKNGNIDCTRYIATPNMMPMVSKIAKILGPRGLMPNPKQGTMTMDVKTAIKNAQAGEVQFRTDARGLTV